MECVEGVFAITQHEVHIQKCGRSWSQNCPCVTEKGSTLALRLDYRSNSVQFYSSLVSRANEIINKAILTETAARSCRHKCSTVITMAAPDA